MTDKTEAVQRMQSYIEQHLTEEITLAQLAEAAHFFSLVFRKDIQGADSPLSCGLYPKAQTVQVGASPEGRECTDNRCCTGYGLCER